MPRIYLLRHAESEANIKGILAGPDNSVKLSTFGIKQSIKLSRYLKDFDFNQIYCSPIYRCHQTILPLLESKPKVKLIQDKNLREMNYGDWNGKKLSDLAKRREWKLIQDSPGTFKFVNGESFIQLRKRVQNFLETAQGITEPILVVSHGDVLKMILTCTIGQQINVFQKFAISPASLSIIEYGKKDKRIISTNQRIAKGSALQKLIGYLPGGENV